MKKKKLTLEKILQDLNIYTQIRMYEKDGYFYAYIIEDNKVIKKVSRNQRDIIKFVVPTINQRWQLLHKNINK